MACRRLQLSWRVCSTCTDGSWHLVMPGIESWQAGSRCVASKHVFQSIHSHTHQPDAHSKLVFRSIDAAVWHRELSERAGGTQPAQEAASASHKDEEEHANESERNLKDILLSKALSHVGEQGWSVKALQAASKEMGLSPMFAGISNETELVEHFIKKCNKDLFDRIDSERPAFTNQSTKVKALAIMARPENVSSGMQLLNDLIDGIWKAAGDHSSDLNYYTKRFTLLGVYSSTELYMIADFSPEHTDTWAALDRRLDDVAMLGERVASLTSALTQQLSQFGRAS